MQKVVCRSDISCSSYVGRSLRATRDYLSNRVVSARTHVKGGARFRGDVRPVSGAAAWLAARAHPFYECGRPILDDPEIYGIRL